MDISSVLNRRNPIAPGYAPSMIYVATELENILNGKPCTFHHGFVGDALELFSRAHGGFAWYGYAVKQSQNPDRILYLDFVGEAYGRINSRYTADIDAIEKKVREGLFFTECLPFVFKSQLIPYSSRENFVELKSIYTQLYHIANRENANLPNSCH